MLTRLLLLGSVAIFVGCEDDHSFSRRNYSVPLESVSAKVAFTTPNQAGKPLIALVNFSSQSSAQAKEVPIEIGELPTGVSPKVEVIFLRAGQVVSEIKQPRLIRQCCGSSGYYLSVDPSRIPEHADRVRVVLRLESKTDPELKSVSAELALRTGSAVGKPMSMLPEVMLAQEEWDPDWEE
ncbi:MAG: hypothetical protein N2112_01420 [Gemmataceae bacterium]|jgi:hypothetical protein|nr:hypothetical protein [Gemmataceae bacterium]